MRHARALSLTFEWDRDTQGLPAATPGKSLKGRGGGEVLRPVSRMPIPPSLIAMTAQGANAVEPAPTTQPTSRPSTYPTSRKKMAGEPTIILWSGPLVVEPVGRNEVIVER